MRTFLSIVLVLLIIAAGALGLYWAIKNIYIGLAGLQKEVAVGIIAVSGTVIVSTLTVVISKYYERKADVQRDLREKKIPVYNELMDFWSRLMSDPESDRKPPTEEEVSEFMTDFLKKIIVWGSDDVLKAFREFRTLAMKAKPNSPSATNTLFLFESLLLAMRKDLGHKNKGFQRGNILALWISDIEQYL